MVNSSWPRSITRLRTVFNPLKWKHVQILFKISVRTAKKTPHFTITKINWLTLFEEIIAVFTENHTKPTKTYTEFLIVKGGGAYSYHLVKRVKLMHPLRAAIFG
jgi:hypothetical protein